MHPSDRDAPIAEVGMPLLRPGVNLTYGPAERSPSFMQRHDDPELMDETLAPKLSERLWRSRLLRADPDIIDGHGRDVERLRAEIRDRNDELDRLDALLPEDVEWLERHGWRDPR